MQPQKLGESMSPGRHRLSAAVVTPPTPLVVGIWQQRGDEEREEPRITRISLTFDRLANPQSRQLAAFEPQSGKWEELRWSLERLQARFGDGRLWRAEHVRPNAARPELRARLGDIGS
jgi:hypothetical protein